MFSCSYYKELKALLVSVSQLSNESTRIAKETILRAFNWSEMQLNYLGLSFVITHREYIRLVSRLDYYYYIFMYISLTPVNSK